MIIIIYTSYNNAISHNLNVVSYKHANIIINSNKNTNC